MLRLSQSKQQSIQTNAVISHSSIGVLCLYMIPTRQRPDKAFQRAYFSRRTRRVGTRFVRCYLDSLSELLLGMISSQKMLKAPELLHKKVAIQALHYCRVVFVLKKKGVPNHQLSTLQRMFLYRTSLTIVALGLNA